MSRPAAIAPFWNRIPFFFLYGLRPVPLGLNIGLAVIAAVLGLSLFGLLGQLVIYFVMTKYCFAVLEDTEAGRLRPPPLSERVLLQGYELPAKLFFLIIFFFAAVFGVTANVAWLAGLMLMLFGLLVLPAAVMILASTESLLEALNPATLVGMIRRIGWPYLALYGLLFMLSLAQSNLEALVLDDLPLTLILPVYNTINFYFSIVMFCMMGYVLLQFHEELGGPTPHDLETAPDPFEAKFAHFDKLMAEGHAQAAKAELQGLIREDPADMEVRRRYHNLLALQGTPDELRRHAGHYVRLLMERDDVRTAAEVLAGLPEDGADIQPDRPEHHAALMRQLRLMGRPKQAVRLASGFHKRFPGSAETAPVYLLMGRILCEDLSRDDLAEKALAYVVHKFPEHPDRAEAESLLGTVRSLRSA